MDEKIKVFNGEIDREVFNKNNHIYNDQFKAYIQFYRNGLIENDWIGIEIDSLDNFRGNFSPIFCI